MHAGNREIPFTLRVGGEGGCVRVCYGVVIFSRQLLLTKLSDILSVPSKNLFLERFLSRYFIKVYVRVRFVYWLG